MNRQLEAPDNLGDKPSEDWMAPGVRFDLEKTQFTHSAWLVFGGGVVSLLIFLAVAALVLRMS